MPNPSNHVILSGCSGGGKSTLLDELARRGVATVPEPGRRIVAEESRGEGKALPWVDMEAFARRALDLATQDRATVAHQTGWVVFDRGLIDAAVALEHAAGVPVAETLGDVPRFHRQVFLTPPWPEIYAADAERRHGIAEAEGEYRRLLAAYEALGYDTVILPKIGVRARADFLLSRLG
ncbi:AAA family ATPase [Roseovarius sp.]|uniref:AAA family ATPase n=1 Tax=Roseovarius sp. TaxID=1486281 RepID=UPI003BAA4DC1